MKKTNNKGFTLVELIVVLVILAILAAILVPALLGYIDRAREKQVTTNAEAAYVAAQAKMTDAYAKYGDPKDYVKKDEIDKLADITEDFEFGATTDAAYSADAPAKNMYIITAFTYYSDTYKQTATWNGSEWTVSAGKNLVGTYKSE